MVLVFFYHPVACFLAVGDFQVAAPQFFGDKKYPKNLKAPLHGRLNPKPGDLRTTMEVLVFEDEHVFSSHNLVALSGINFGAPPGPSLAPNKLFERPQLAGFPTDPKLKQ